MDTADRFELLKKAGFDLPREAARALAADFRMRSLDVGGYLFHEGAPGNSLHIVQSGKVEAVTTSLQGRELIFGSMGPGDVIGELTIIVGEDRTAGVRAVEPSVVHSISRAAFLAHARRHPEIALTLAGLCARRARNMSAWASKTSFASLEARLAATLLALEDSSTQSRTVITITQQALGDRLGVSRESINKWLRAWQRDGIVELGRRMITVVDAKHLEATALTTV